MQRRTFIKRTGAAGLIAFITPTELVQNFQYTGSTPEEEFLDPPISAYPQAYWFWMNGNVTKEGITLDLEAMKEAGVGGIFNFDVGTGIPKGPVAYLSSEWAELKKHAIREAARLGLEFTMHNCPGWSSSGGPWITPELAMQQITWGEAFVKGGMPISLQLPKPPNRLEYYRDIVVLAYPSLKGEELLQTLKIVASNGPVDVKQVMGGDPKGVPVHPRATNEPAWLQIEFEAPYEARLITFYISAIATTNEKTSKPLEFGERSSITLEASDDGNQFRLVTPINIGLETELLLGDKFIAFDIPVTKAKYFRLTSSKPRRYRQVQLSGITRLKNWMEKTNLRGRYVMYVDEPSTIHTTNQQEVTSGSRIDLNSVLNISENLDKDGLLNWNAPAGNWTILRIGFTPTGTLNRAAPETGIGLECDKFNPEAITYHFNKVTEPFLPLIKSLGQKIKMGLEIDSYEAGTQNWTLGFERRFSDYYGYDLIKYLPIITGGRIIVDVNITERFLWDFRKLQGVLMAENYYDQFHQLCQQNGITSYIEPYEIGPMEEMRIGSKVDVNIGEFWYGISSVLPIKNPASRTPKLATSIGHINGQKVTGAEAFTAEPDSAKWQEYPFAMKAVGDKIFTKGINRMIIHRYAHQPHSSTFPGMTMGPWGIHFDRTNTWWNQGKAWLSYLSRCQNMLQQGRYVADLVYFTGEDTNMYTRANSEELDPAPPEGYDYDLINAEIIINQVKVIDNQIVLTNGITYRIFILQNYKAVTLSLLQKLRFLVDGGMILVGAKPERSTGLAEYSDRDTTFNQITNDLWGNINGKTITKHHYGKGRIYWGLPLSSILQELKIQPDFEYSSRSGDAPMIYTHRKIEGGDIYFLSNQRRSHEEVVCTFRVSGLQPELWDASTGKIIPGLIYEILNDRVRMPIQFEPYGSVFVVFRKPPSKNYLHGIEKDHAPIASTKNFSPSPRQLYSDRTDSFTINFWAKPEINVLLNPRFIMGSINEPWTEYYAIYPPSGKKLYGAGHATCGIAVGRNGVAVWEHATERPVLVLAASIAISGWSHIALVYNKRTPSVYVNGKLIKTGKRSNHIIHPALGKAYLAEGASFYNGDMSKPTLYTKVLSKVQILQKAKEHPLLYFSPFNMEMVGSKPALLIKQNGTYLLRSNSDKISSFQISDVGKPYKLEGPWEISFPTGLGAPDKIILPELISLHKHSVDGVKYFSGTATYTKSFTFLNGLPTNHRWLLDLGRVEVIAEVRLNGKDFGILWKRPFCIDVTHSLKAGLNILEVRVTNLWPNRLIGDEQLPDPDKFSPGGGSSGLESLTSGTIEELPEWYIEGKPKPINGRVTFTTWKHYTKDSPLLESGLIGPVVFHPAVLKQI